MTASNFPSDAEIKRTMELCERATPGEWYVDGDEVRVDLSPDTTDSGVADCSVSICQLYWISAESDYKRPDREYIAHCNPDFVMRLARGYEAALEVIRFVADDFVEEGIQADCRACDYDGYITQRHSPACEFKRAREFLGRVEGKG